MSFHLSGVQSKSFRCKLTCCHGFRILDFHSEDYQHFCIKKPIFHYFGISIFSIRLLTKNVAANRLLHTHSKSKLVMVGSVGDHCSAWIWCLSSLMQRLTVDVTVTSCSVSTFCQASITFYQDGAADETVQLLSANTPVCIWPLTKLPNSSYLISSQFGELWRVGSAAVTCLPNSAFTGPEFETLTIWNIWEVS